MNKSYWQQHPGAAIAATPAPAEAEIVIIGGGMAGISAALAVLERRPDASPVVLEADFVGFGASGRNGGLLSPLPAPVWLLTADTDTNHAWALQALNRKLHDRAAWLATHVPDSEIMPVTLKLYAMGRLSASGLRKVSATLRRTGIAHTVAPDPARDGKPTLEIAAYTVHPYRLVRALAARAISLGARVCEGARVASIEDTGNGAVVHLADGQRIRARNVLVSTNAYTPSIVMPAPPRAKVVRNYMLATGALDQSTLARLGQTQNFMVELNPSYIFYRVHQDRLVYGGVETFFRTPESDFDVPPSIQKALRKHLAKSIPGGAAFDIAAEWGGAFHSTATDLPIIRRSRETKAISFNVGYGGTGMALTQLFAPQAAATLLGLPAADLDDARLHAILQSTKVPLKRLVQFGGSVAWDVVKGGR
jgi:gamma-glutamylputrescine oxidase